ncbi:hypothetical protein MIND_01326900 [Mycena indigotica]|uniref:Uncharacterized protein n=1 Tax=Mycena indigotica TaxID=2126181 RepID=A0A8H6S1S4_9AGAR|nr:uncharacterized protein MIND_01326900 [Mycena indigotica]KAF7290857.1 hypothetical protein MIND_01326900 [Mycena indigotica]
MFQITFNFSSSLTASNSASSLMSLDVPGGWKSSYEGKKAPPKPTLSPQTEPSKSAEIESTSATIPMDSTLVPNSSSSPALAPSVVPDTVQDPTPISPQTIPPSQPETTTSPASTCARRIGRSPLANVLEISALLSVDSEPSPLPTPAAQPQPSFAVDSSDNSTQASRPSTKGGIYGPRRGPTARPTLDSQITTTEPTSTVSSIAAGESDGADSTESASSLSLIPSRKTGIYGDRRGPGSQPVSGLPASQDSSTSETIAPASPDSTSDADPAPRGRSMSVALSRSVPAPSPEEPSSPSALAPTPREGRTRTRVASVRARPQGRDLSFGGVIPRSRQSSALRITVTLRVALFAERAARERQAEQERIEMERRELYAGVRLERMAAQVQQVKRRYKNKLGVLKGWAPSGGQETEWVLV